MNSHNPDGVADALRSYLEAIDRVIANYITDEEIETRLRRLTEQDRPSAPHRVDRSEPVPPTHEPPRVTRFEAKEALTILAVCDEWFPGTGGISAFNRYLCRALSAAGHTVWCLV